MLHFDYDWTEKFNCLELDDLEDPIDEIDAVINEITDMYTRGYMVAKFEHMSDNIESYAQIYTELLYFIRTVGAYR